jgi:hypothetical protein
MMMRSMTFVWTLVSVMMTIMTMTITMAAAADQQQQQQPLPPEYHARPNYVGPRDRFWRHHKEQETLVVDGVDYYHTIWNCLNSVADDTVDDGALSLAEQEELETVLETTVKPQRSVGQRIVDMPKERWGNVILVEVQHAMAPLQVKAVQRLAHCVRTYLPQFFEVRAMYKEFNLEQDEGLGGNTPTHLMPFLGIYLPTIVETIMSTVRFAYDHAGWQGLTIRDIVNGNLPTNPEVIPSTKVGRKRSSIAIPMPEQLGFRASEHLTYDDFPLLDAHFDGADTAFTVNFALAGPKDYDGGYLYVVDSDGQKTFFKPQKYSCVVFLGGTYYHGVTQITGGRREMFSNELWFNPDLPLGSTLWNSDGENMDDYIRDCNKAGHVGGEGPCPVSMSDKTQHGVSRTEILNHLDQVQQAKENGQQPPPNPVVEETDSEDLEEDSDDDYDIDGEEEEEAGQEYWKEGERYRYLREELRNNTEEFYSAKEEPDFMVPRILGPGDVFPVYWRDNLERIKDDEAFVIGLPPELLVEFTKYIEASGLLDLARAIAYDTLPEDQKFNKDLEHKLYTLKDGQTWGTMHPQWSGNDMVWIDPGDEECFESLLHVLRKGNFDTVLESVAELYVFLLSISCRIVLSSCLIIHVCHTAKQLQLGRTHDPRHWANFPQSF